MHMEKTLVILSLILCVSLHAQEKQATTRVSESLDIFNDVMRQVDVNYVDTLNYEMLTETAIQSMLRKIDPYTVYYSKKQDKDLRMLTQGKYGGIGSIIQQRPRPDMKGTKLKGKAAKDSLWTYAVNPYEGKPAQRAGVMAGDRIVSIDGKSTAGLTVSEVSNNLRGEPGTTVVLELEREGVEKPFKVSIVREDIHLEPVSYYTTYVSDSLPDPVGYIAFGEFTEGSAQAFSNALDDLYYNKGARSLVMDLRGNGGGLVEEAMQILSLFVDRDTKIVETRGKSTRANFVYKTRNNPRYKDLPLVILVDKHSASASEIVSGSLHDLGRAKLVGQKTFGKGLVQNVRPIVHGGHVKVTTSKYYLPSDSCIQGVGITPDVVMDDSGKVDITYSLYVDHYFFDYATRYRRTHDSIAAPEVFELTDEEIADFCNFLDEKGFQYETETSKYFDDMIKMAKHEDIDSASLAQLEALAPILKPDFRKAIERNKEEVKQLLGAEIVLRYYYQKGQAAFTFRYDKEFKRAVRELRIDD